MHAAAAIPMTACHAMPCHAAVPLIHVRLQAGVLQTCLILASGLVCWFFHQAADAGLYSYI